MKPFGISTFPHGPREGLNLAKNRFQPYPDYVEGRPGSKESRSRLENDIPLTTKKQEHKTNGSVEQF